MDLVGHQSVRPHIQFVVVRVLLEHCQVDLAVSGGAEDMLAPVATMSHAVRGTPEQQLLQIQPPRTSYMMDAAGING
ncbi:MAG: hypothetical protein ACR2IE_10040 [Candidatus Sumerlaeaceae bacterium]